MVNWVKNEKMVQLQYHAVPKDLGSEEFEIGGIKARLGFSSSADHNEENCTFSFKFPFESRKAQTRSSALAPAAFHLDCEAEMITAFPFISFPFS